MSQQTFEAGSEDRVLEALVCFQEGSLQPSDRDSLVQVLERDPQVRRLFIEMQLRSMAIHDHFRQAAYRVGGRSMGRSWVRWILSRAVATAAGIALGICCTSLVFAYALPWNGRLSTMFFDSFEAGPAPATAGVPSAPGQWGGDYVEIVGPHAGVRPAHGHGMLRFLRGDHDGMPQDDSRSSTSFRLFDIRHLREELRQDTAIVQLSALFNAAASDGTDPVTCALTVFALDEQTLNDTTLKVVGTLSRESLAMAVSAEVTLDNDPASWQRVSNELRLPPETDYVMIRVGVSRNRGSAKPEFGAHYADNVRLILGHRPELTSH
jgi:hypothetical protein